MKRWKPAADGAERKRDDMADQVTIEVFEPPMCCAGGMCGPVADEKLLQFNEALLSLRKQFGGAVAIFRYLPNQQIAKFQENAEVIALLSKEGTDVLPVTAVNGSIRWREAYPTLEELTEAVRGSAK